MRWLRPRTAGVLGPGLACLMACPAVGDAPSADLGSDSGSSVGADDGPGEVGTSSRDDSTSNSTSSGNDATTDAPPGDDSSDGGEPAPDPCLDDGTCPPGVWIDVTPPEVDPHAELACSNYGSKSVQVDPRRPHEVYASYNCQGIWTSTDYGFSWTGPVNTGENGAAVGDCAGAVELVAGDGDGAPVLYQACIRSGTHGDGLGLWRSRNGGVDWTRLVVTAGADISGQQFYTPTADPYDSNHLLMTGHGVDLLVRSEDAGDTWTEVVTDAGMAQNGGTGAIAFVDTGEPMSSRTTWLWLAAQSGGGIGTWRTEDAGTTWTRVDSNEHTNGSMHSEVYQPDTSGLVYIAGVYSTLGSGVLRSTDFGLTWTHVGQEAQQAVVFGTPKHVYAMFGWGIGTDGVVDPQLEVGDLSDAGGWAMPGTPPEMTQGPGQAAVTHDGTYAILLVANYNAGVWRYVEPID
jgi:hypothetical protein